MTAKVHPAARHRFGDAIASLALAGGRSAVLLVLVPGLCTALWWALLQATRDVSDDVPLAIIAALVASAAFAATLRLAQRATPLPVRGFWSAALLAGIALRAGWVFLAEPAWVSDFERYWQVGLSLSHAPLAQVLTIYEQRATFLTLPVIEVFGDSRLALQLCNVAWLALVQVVGYDLVRRAAGHARAQAFAVAWIAAFEPTLAAGIPSHDLIALMLLVVAFWLAVVASRGPGADAWQVRLAAGIAAGAVVAWLEALRGIGLLYIALVGLLAVTCVLVGVLRSPQARPAPAAWRAAQHVLVAALVAASVGAALNAAGRTLDPDAIEISRIRHTAAHATALSDGTWRFGRDFSVAFLESPGADRAWLSDLRRSLALGDLQAPQQKLASMYARMPRQYALGSQQAFYLTGTPPALRAFAVAYGHLHLMGFAALLLIVTWHLLRAPGRDPAATVLLLFVTLLSLVLLLVGENQSRYIFPIWFAGAYGLATCLSPTAAATPSPNVAPHVGASVRVREAAGWLATAAVMLVLSLLAARLLAFAATRNADGRILSRWQYASAPAGDAAALDRVRHAPPGKPFAIAGRTLGARSLKLMLSRPPALEREVSAATEVCGISPGTTLEFFHHFPAKRLRVEAPFALAVDLQNEERWRTPLPDRAASAPVPVSLPIEADARGCVALRFRLLAQVEYAGASWIDASYVEIMFPRLRAR